MRNQHETASTALKTMPNVRDLYVEAKKRNAYRLLAGKPQGRRPLGRARRRWVDNIKMDLGEDRLCGLVVRLLGYRFGGPGSIPGTTRFSEEKKKRKTCSGSGTGYTQPREYN
jgi:hypothetical protein